MSSFALTLARFNWRGKCIPVYMYSGIIGYVENGVIPGNFLQAIICNNLKNAYQFADDTNIELIGAYVAFFFNHVPVDIWGSFDAMIKHSTECGSRKISFDKSF